MNNLRSLALAASNWQEEKTFAPRQENASALQSSKKVRESP